MVDLEVKKEERDSLILLEKISKTNSYISKDWNKEEAFRYVLKQGWNIIEASLFVHYFDEKEVKKVIELPCSFGCIVGCKFCASGVLNPIKMLKHWEIVDIFNYIVKEQKIKKSDPILITYTGIGESALNEENIKKSCLSIQSVFYKSKFNIGTVGIKPSFIRFCQELSNVIFLRYLQISYITYDHNRIQEIIPNMHQYDYMKIIEEINNSSINIRINYLMILNFNDNIDHWIHFVTLTRSIKDRIIIRISKLNKTEISTKNKLETVQNAALIELNEFLKKHNFNSYLYLSDDSDNLNCGQLSWNYYNNQ